MTGYPAWLAAYPNWEQVSWAQIRGSLDVFFPRHGFMSPAYVIVTYSWDIYLDDGGKPQWAHRKEEPYAWPLQRERLIADVTERVPYADISICPNPMRDKRRHKGNSLTRFSAKADIDGGFHAEMERAVRRVPGAGVLGSGTPGHVHVHVLMHAAEDELDLANYEHLCRVLGESFGAQDHKIADNDTMRLGGTFNFKPLAYDPDALPLPVRWLVWPPEPYHRPTPTRVRQYLGVRKVGPGYSGTSGGAGGSGPGFLAETEPVQLTWLLGVKAALRKRTKTGDPHKDTDRSVDTHRIVGACVSAGLTLAQTRWVVNQREDLRQRIAARHDDEVLRCFTKVSATHDEKAQG